MKRLGFAGTCIADELALSELSAVVLRDLGTELNRTATENLKLNSQNVLRHPDHMERVMNTLAESWRKGTSSAFAEILDFFNLPLPNTGELEKSEVKLPGGNILRMFSGSFLIIIQHLEPGVNKIQKPMVFASDWIERLTRCLSGSLLSFFTMDLTFYCLKSASGTNFPSTVLNFEQELDSLDVRGERKTYSDWRSSMKRLLRHLESVLSFAASQNNCDEAKMELNKAAGSMKFWVAMMAKQSEPGENAFKELSYKDFIELKDDAVKEGGMLMRRWINLIEEVEKDWDLQPFDLLNLVRCYVLFPIGSYEAEDIQQAFDAVDGKIEGEASLEERTEYLRCAISLQRRLKAAYLKTGREVRSPSIFIPDTESWESREHWAAKTEEFQLLSEKEKKEAQEVDSTTKEAPLNFFDIMSMEADDHGTVDTTSRKNGAVFERVPSLSPKYVWRTTRR